MDESSEAVSSQSSNLSSDFFLPVNRLIIGLKNARKPTKPAARSCKIILPVNGSKYAINIVDMIKFALIMYYRIGVTKYIKNIFSVEHFYCQLLIIIIRSLKTSNRNIEIVLTWKLKLIYQSLSNSQDVGQFDVRSEVSRLNRFYFGVVGAEVFFIVVDKNCYNIGNGGLLVWHVFQQL